ncbi:(2Fe-2S)-binding protein [Pseudonocardia sp. WMMC193]|uniref:(2Fe-2S)-binding protein n=1 Tax=Pseudonocardia sp. WMMC193 TaxID=2911965 RepID=UPI001F2AB7AB|nr:2Fe-2S iron-sulfur cluster-binding protein [Pseudonocardia sp. WMMC193]MCF7552741.1 2Fe-2S iron-sulfur cluster-binding protein [Pseudonocardia sp. WMMC193]
MDPELTLTVDGATHTTTCDTRTSLLDLLRQRLGITSPKKGCDHGQCGACTVLVDGRRVLSCLILAVTRDGAEVVTAAGIDGPLPQAFQEADGLQCGYCTPGQVCSAAGVLDEHARGLPSVVTADLTDTPALDDAEIAERMSGNLCRCGAYKGIREAVRTVAGAATR